MIKSKEKIILASGSQTRRQMLESLGLEFDVQSSSVDEDLLKKEFTGVVSELGLFLAQAKAKQVSNENLNAYVIAADQVCLLGEKIFDKPGTFEKSVEHLKELAGKTHSQNCSACIFHHGQEIWNCIRTAEITMRDLSDIEINAYVELEKPFQCAGSYMLEKHGKHIFSKVDGDHDVILGLPLVDILSFLYEEKILSLELRP